MVLFSADWSSGGSCWQTTDELTGSKKIAEAFVVFDVHSLKLQGAFDLSLKGMVIGPNSIHRWEEGILSFMERFWAGWSLPWMKVISTHSPSTWCLCTTLDAVLEHLFKTDFQGLQIEEEAKSHEHPFCSWYSVVIWCIIILSMGNSLAEAWKERNSYAELLLNIQIHMHTCVPDKSGNAATFKNSMMCKK